MAKLVHVLKKIEYIDRDIKELHEIINSLSNQRSYSHSLLISIELQINNLLNERVKLMELEIKNPPEYLKHENKESSFMEYYQGNHNKDKTFNLDSYEEIYLPKLMKTQSLTKEVKNTKEEDGDEKPLNYNIQISASSSNKKQQGLKDELKNSTAENNKESNEDKKEKFNFNSFLKNDFVGLENLPKIDY